MKEAAVILATVFSAAFMLATEIREDDSIFIPTLESASAALGTNEATIAALLKAPEM